jgi:hypothetical protein
MKKQNMIFTFGKYKDYEVYYVIKIDRKYCEWILEKNKKKDNYKELNAEIVKRLSEIEPEAENSSNMMFGKYEGEKIDDIILLDKSYCKWLLGKDSFKNEYPKTYNYLQKYFEIIYIEQASSVVFFYILTFCKRDYLKVGITSNFIVQRIYSYIHSMNFYQNDIIDYKNSFVFMSNDIEIEKKVLKNFKELRIDRKTERVKTSVKEIESYIEELKRVNHEFYYSKKCINDFIPFNYGNEFKNRLHIKINEFVNFRNIYEIFLRQQNLIDKYNPEFIEISQNKN